MNLTINLRATNREKKIVCSDNLPNKAKVNFLKEKWTVFSFYEALLSFNQIAL